jgi:heterodisulfide reductase subunit D
MRARARLAVPHHEFLEIVGASLGLRRDDHFKRLKMLQDADAILADCRDLVEQHGLDFEATRRAITAMLYEQPVPLRGAT